MEVIAFTGTPRSTEDSRRDRNFHAPGTGDPDGTIPTAWFQGLSKPELHNFLGQNVDVLVMALPLTPQTRHLISQAELEMLNKSRPVFLVNVARGEVLDQDALLEYLNKGPSAGGLSGAALDVADPEPLPSSSELWGAPNIFISPHVSSITSGTMNRVFQVLEGNLERLAKGERMLNIFKDA
jgi:phosphoglycerate dehydrogenase-like enzyme